MRCLPFERQPGFFRRDDETLLVLFALPDFAQVEHLHLHFPDMLVDLGMRDERVRQLHQVRRLGRGLAKEGVAFDPRPFDDVVLQHAVGDDHIRTQKLLTVGKLLNCIFPVVHHHLEIEPGHVLAGPAGAGGIDNHLPQRTGKDDIEIFQCFHQGLRLAEMRLRDVHKDRVAPEAGDHKRVFDVGELHVEQVLQRRLGMVQLRLGQELGVARDVGEDEIAFFRHESSSLMDLVF